MPHMARKGALANKSLPFSGWGWGWGGSLTLYLNTESFFMFGLRRLDQTIHCMYQANHLVLFSLSISLAHANTYTPLGWYIRQIWSRHWRTRVSFHNHHFHFLCCLSLLCGERNSTMGWGRLLCWPSCGYDWGVVFWEELCMCVCPCV